MNMSNDSLMIPFNKKMISLYIGCRVRTLIVKLLNKPNRNNTGERSFVFTFPGATGSAKL